jgi:putative spermidine/putrescine transport system ATP-binding protein
MGGEALAVEEVEVTYGATRVLQAITLAVAPGRFVALLGSSGCGKTTLLRAISGFAPVRAGRVLLGGRDITGLPPEQRGMAMVFQSYALWPHMTTAQNLAYGLKLRGVARAERRRRVAEVMALLGLEGLGNRSVTQLSGGQRQRVALGRALAINPGILLLDEPLSNLDARIRQTVRHEIKALQQQLGITAIHVTHDREEAMVMADAIAIMDQGHIVQFGPPEDVYNRPASPFVAAFMGADNVIPLRIERAGHAVRVAPGPDNEAAQLACGEAANQPTVHLADGTDGAVLAHFRSAAARLVPHGERAPDSLVLRGLIRQSSYPGGFYRYAVTVGGQEYFVDDERRFATGEPVGICLPAEALHLYPRETAAGAAAKPAQSGSHPAWGA